MGHGLMVWIKCIHVLISGVLLMDILVLIAILLALVKGILETQFELLLLLVVPSCVLVLEVLVLHIVLLN
jgi:hypothetical protein